MQKSMIPPHDPNEVRKRLMPRRGALRWRLIRRDSHMESEMAKKVTRSRPWTKEELRMLKTLTREKTRMVIARKLKRSIDAMYGLAQGWAS